MAFLPESSLSQAAAARREGTLERARGIMRKEVGDVLRYLISVALLFSAGSSLPESILAGAAESADSLDCIAFNSEAGGASDIYLMNAGGNDVVRLTNDGSSYWSAWSPDGSWLAYTSKANSDMDIYGAAADGTGKRRITDGAGIDREPAVSPDGRRIVFESGRDGNPEIYVMNVDGTGETRLTNDAAVDVFANWSPDGGRIVFCSNRAGNFEIYSMDTSGADLRRLTHNDTNDWLPKCSPDGTEIAFIAERDGNKELYVMRSDGADPRRLTNDPGRDCDHDWSPDGARIAFASDRAGNYDIYVAELGSDRGIANLRRLTTDPRDERHPAWRPRR